VRRNYLADIIFPINCLGCGRESQRGDPRDYLCDQCLDTIPNHVKLACLFCSAPTTAGEICPFCRKEHHLDYFWSVTEYGYPLVNRTIQAFKYRFVQALGEPLARLLINYWRNRRITETLKDNPLLVPVPLHRQRKNWRAYNQAEVLAEYLSKAINLKLADGALTRPIRRSPQAEITDPNKRRANATNLYACPDPVLVCDQTIVLIDDVATTGSTLDECARVLKQAGAKTVAAFVVAKG